jgi:hypothetical protein
MAKRKKREQPGKSNADGEVQPICRLEVRLATGDLRELVRCHGRAIMDGKSVPLLCSIDGFLHDQRELWQIPEVIALSERVIESGLVPNQAKAEREAQGGLGPSPKGTPRPAGHFRLPCF